MLPPIWYGKLLVKVTDMGDDFKTKVVEFLRQWDEEEFSKENSGDRAERLAEDLEKFLQ